MDKNNLKLLKRYKLICKNKGLTKESIKAICDIDIPLFLRFIGDTPLNEVNHIMIEDFLEYCSEQRGNKPITLNRKFTSLNSFFKTMIKKEYLDMRNPLDKLDKIKTRKKIRPHLTVEEYSQILNYLDKTNNLRDSALIAFFYSSACRLTEVWQQNRNTINFETRRFKVLGKGDKERICIFSKDATERIRKYLQSREDNHPALFISREKNRLSKKSIQDAVKRAGKRAGVKKNVHPHIFRHTRAMHLIQKGVPLEKIQQLLGHENISTTQIYAHMSIGDIQADIDKIDERKGVNHGQLNNRRKNIRYGAGY